MPNESPLPNWNGTAVYVIGGGASLRGFNWDSLIPLPTIGCNQAFLLGKDVCKVCAFGDRNFWTSFRDELAKFGGWVVTNFPLPQLPSWVKSYKRIDHGLARDELGWNSNTGAMATNLALVLGASIVYLLGFDMQPKTPKVSHWHDRRLEVPSMANYSRFMSGFDTVAQLCPSIFPDARVYNVSNGSSRLRAFPTVTFEQAGLVSPGSEDVAA